MIRLSRMADYGSLLLTHMAASPEQAVHNAADLAAATRLPAPTVSKILKRLAREGLLTSLRGAKGGYRLARPATAITLAEVIQALEGGPVALTECSSPESTEHCDLEPQCLVRRQWQRINRAFYDTLGGITLDDMIQPLTPQEPSRRKQDERQLTGRIA